MRGDIGFHVEGEHGDKTLVTSFSTRMMKEDASAFAELMGGPQPVEVFIYKTADLPWWKDWYWRLRGRLLGDPYPEEVIAHGEAYMDGTIRSTNGDEILVEGHFRSTGTWEVEP